MGPLAGPHGVTVVLEPLNKGETNFFNSVAEGIGLVDAIAHPNIQLLADIYHMLREDEGPESILKAGARLRHCHIAEKESRTSPGTKGDDFRPYFKALKAIGYQGGVSVEGKWGKPVEDELPRALKTMKEQCASA
jgi:sugar phosphate isomerase/epimerase